MATGLKSRPIVKRKIVEKSAPPKTKLDLPRKMDQFDSFEDIEKQDAFFSQTTKPTKRRKSALPPLRSRVKDVNFRSALPSILPSTLPSILHSTLPSTLSSTLPSTSEDIDCGAILQQQMPEELDDLVVNKKKINEVETWLRQKIKNDDSNKCLLISGPSGSGKSSTIQFLCDELDIEAIEFDPEQQFNFNEREDEEAKIYNQSQVESFRASLLASQTRNVESSARTRKLIIVKELPTTLTAKPKELFNFLQGTLPLLTAFLVFSLTKIESSYELNPYRLFPEETLRQLKIHHIKFNAIPPTVMTKKVNYWIECLKIPKNASFTKSIVEKADGDIRSAMLLLEMSFSNKRLVNLDFLCSMDSPLTLFHFLGKIFYAKRLETVDKKWNAIEKKLNDDVKPEYRRAFPPDNDLNLLANSSTLSYSALTDFVMEHEMNFCKNSKALSKVYSDICETIYLSSPFPVQINPTIQDISRQISVRSITFNNYSDRKSVLKGKYTFTKSTIGESRKRCAELLDELNLVYPSTSVVDTKTFTLPLLGKMDSYITEDEARLCENVDPKFKLNPKRLSRPNTRQITFDICDDSD